MAVMVMIDDDRTGCLHSSVSAVVAPLLLFLVLIAFFYTIYHL